MRVRELGMAYLALAPAPALRREMDNRLRGMPLRDGKSNTLPPAPVLHRDELESVFQVFKLF